MRKKSIDEPINGNIVKKQLTHRQTLMNICEIMETIFESNGG
jgi:hypothetical protein